MRKLILTTATAAALCLAGCGKKEAVPEMPKTSSITSDTQLDNEKTADNVDSSATQNQEFSIDFVGYDGQSPIFASFEWGGGKAIGHNGIYKYANGRLTKIDAPIRKGTQCLMVKNDVYVFGYGDSLYYPTKLQFKRNGRETFFEQTVTWPAYVDGGRVTMNNEDFFAIAGLGKDTSVIFRMKYRVRAKIDTIKINGLCVGLLDVTNDHLYYIIEYPDEPSDGDNISRGSVYRMNLRDGSHDEILENVDADDTRCTGIAPHLNMAYSWGTLTDYNQNNRIQAQNYNRDAIVFFSYEHNAFVDYKTTSDINHWDCYHLAPGRKLPTALQVVQCFKEIKGTK
jgi:predicted small lipoprotein YifL